MCSPSIFSRSLAVFLLVSVNDFASARVKKNDIEASWAKAKDHIQQTVLKPHRAVAALMWNDPKQQIDGRRRNDDILTAVPGWECTLEGLRRAMQGSAITMSKADASVIEVIKTELAQPKTMDQLNSAVLEAAARA